MSLSVREGEFVVVMGPSGSGKTTLLNIIGTLDKPSSGQVLIDGQDISRFNDGQLTRLRRYKIGFVFQFHNLIPVLTALENVQLPMQMSGVKSKTSEGRARELLDHVGLTDRLDHLPDELSGGEQQRVAIARALANHPRIILADEPTGDLDTKTGSEVVQIMYDLTKQENAAVIVVTHDPLIAEKAERLFEMRDGKIRRETNPVQLTIRAADPVLPESHYSLPQPN